MENGQPPPAGTRWFDAIFGTLVLGCGVAGLVVAAGEPLRTLLSGGLLLLGAEALVAVARGRPSLLSRIGPLP